MSDTVQIIVAICSVLSTIGVAYFGYKTALIKAQLNQVHGEMNGMKDALVKQSGELGEEKGNKQGRIELKAEQKEEENK